LLFIVTQFVSPQDNKERAEHRYRRDKQHENADVEVSDEGSVVGTSERSPAHGTLSRSRTVKQQDSKARYSHEHQQS
jgi:hypothetical protein